MADAQLPVKDDVKAALLRSDEEFRQLVSEHHALDEQIRQLVPFGTAPDRFHGAL